MLPDLDSSNPQFTPENAYVLMRASQAAYSPEQESYLDRLKELGITRTNQEWFAAGHDAGFLGWTDSWAVLCFRGTANPGAWVSNLYGAVPASRSDEYFGRVHPGFADAVDILWNSFFPRLSGELSDRPLFITGHSRGGALATLAAQALVYQGITPAAVFTFGAPRVGSTGFVTKYDIANHFRVENDRDIVPHVPPRPAFRHVGARIWLDQDGDLDEEGPNETPTVEVVSAVFRDAQAGVLGRGSVSALGAVAAQGLLAREFFSDHADTEYAYWLWRQLPDAARADAATSKYA